MGKKKSKTSDVVATQHQNQQQIQVDKFLANLSVASKENANPINLDALAVDEEGELMEMLQVDLGDMVKMKQVLDEAVVGAVLEHVDEDYKWDNFKLGLMATACIFAMIAQFAPVPFPKSRPILGVCGSAYFILSGVLQFITFFIDQDSILLTRPISNALSTPTTGTVINKTKSNSNNVVKDRNQDLAKYGICVRSSLPRFSEWYTVVLELRMEEKSNKSDAVVLIPHKVKHTWSVGQFFDKEGYFDEVGLTQEVDKLFKRLEAADYDTEQIVLTTKKKQ